MNIDFLRSHQSNVGELVQSEKYVLHTIYNFSFHLYMWNENMQNVRLKSKKWNKLWQDLNIEIFSIYSNFFFIASYKDYFFRNDK